MAFPKFFIYSRKSVFTGKGESVENQAEMCRQYIFSKFPDGSVSEDDIAVYEDEGFSAKNTDRPRFQQMLRDMRERSPDWLVCYRLDRISRSVSDFSALIEELNDRGIAFICIKEEFDTSKPMGKAMMYIASVFAQLERETIAERVRDNMLMLARTGRWLGGTAPLGYSSEKVREIIIDGRIKTVCKLKEKTEELAIVDAVFDKFLEVRSVSGVSKFLISRNIRSRSGKFFSLPGIKEILQNPAYCAADKDAFEYFSALNADLCFGEKDCTGSFGLLAYNKRDCKKKNAPRRSADQWIIAVGKHRGHISGRKWTEVQKIIEDNIPTGKKPAKTHNAYALLSGIIRCERCGNRMFAKPRCVKSPESGADNANGLYDYICAGKLRGGVKLCSCPNIGGKQADELVCAELARYAEESPKIFSRLERLKQEILSSEKESPVSAIEAAIKKCSDEADNLISTLSQGDVGAAFIQRVSERIAELDGEIKRLEAEKAIAENAESLSSDDEALPKLAEELSDLKKSLADPKKLSLYEKRSIVRLLTKKILWDGENMRILIGGE